MRIAIVHYHLRTGGVTRIIQHAVSALRRQGIEAVVLSGEAPVAGLDLPVRVMPGLRYEEQRPTQSTAELAADLRRVAGEALGGAPDVWHVHNHSLGKNLALPEALWQLARDGHRLLLQIHDFAEDGRPGIYRRLVDSVGRGDGGRLSDLLYPQAAQLHYAVLNGRDLGFLGAAGVPPERLHALPNPVWMAEQGVSEDTPRSDGRLWLYPTRAIRRKNLGEFLLWAAAAEDGDRFATTLGPENPTERPAYERWMAVAAQLKLPVEFEIGARSPLSFEALLRTAHALVTTSVAEGFGMAFLEPWLVDRPVTGRDLPEVTAEFSAAGVDLDDLYQCCEVPLEWIGEDRLAAKVAQALERVFGAYGRCAGGYDREAALGAWTRDGRVDFGRLDEQLQEAVLRRVADSRSARHELTPTSLAARRDDTLLADNRRAILENYSLDHYGPRLIELYQTLAAAPAEPLANLAPQAVLDQFLDPARLFLLRS